MVKRSNFAIQKQREPTSIVSAGFKSLAGLSLAAAGGWILYSNLAIDHHVFLPEALPVERKTFQSQSAGLISYYSANRNGQGRPLVLVHSINAAASAYEMRPLFLNYFNKRPVYALDLPGFGFSDRAKRVYSPALYEAAILEFIETQVEGGPVDIVGLSLGSEFVARAALKKPKLFNSLGLISPTGFSQSQDKRGSQKASGNGMSDFLHPAFSFPLWGRPLYDLLATRSSIEFFLKKSFVGAVPSDLVEYAYATSHQSGAENAPFYFISGKLFTPDIRRSVYERLQIPTLMLYDRDGFTNFDLLPDLLSKNKFIQAIRLVPTLGLPHFERPEDTAEVFDRFWK